MKTIFYTRTNYFVPVLLFVFVANLLIVFNPANAHEENLSLHSEAAILIDGTTGEILYDKNGTSSMYPASITKIITGIIAIEEGDLEDKVTISEEATQVIGTRVYLLEGEQVSLLNLIKGMLLNSGNDAATAIAEYVDGSEEKFAERMNKFVREKAGAEDTHFQNPHGLFDPGQVTIAADMAKITQYALRNDTFREIVGMKEMEWKGEGWETTIYNHHQLVRRDDRVTGVKNGYVRQSGFTLVTSATKDQQIELIAVTLKSPSSDFAYQDTQKLLEYGFAHYQTNKLDGDEIFKDDQNNRHRLEQPLHFTSLIDEEWTSEVNQGGTLIIRGEEGNILAESPLEKERKATIQVASAQESELQREESEETAAQPVTAENPDNGQSAWWVTLILFFLLLLIFIRNRRRRRKRYWDAPER